MTRKEFVKMCSILGISIPFQSTLSACSSNDQESIPTNFTGKVIIIGAGPAGMTAGYLLAQKGIDFEILEALPTFGGRIKNNTTFTDFPIPLGAEWLHVKKDIFSEIVNDNSVDINIDTKPYDFDDDIAINGETGEQFNFNLTGFGIDQKFINSSWLDFYKTYIVPSIISKIRYNSTVNAINYDAEKIKVSTYGGLTFEANKVIITAPLKLLQSGILNFTPELSSNKINAMNNTTVWSGFKAFFEFSEKFYPTVINYDIKIKKNGEKMYYDAAYGQNSSKNILGVFSVGIPAEDFIAMDDATFKNTVLKELDALFDNKATSNYIKHITQNWNDEPYAKGAYITDVENYKNVQTLGESVNNKLYFAGDAYTTGEDWSSVHTAARSALRAVNEILN